MPQRYHPIADSLWDDAKLETLTFEGKAFFCFLCANRRQRPSGIYRATDAQLAADTGLTVKAVKTYLVSLQSSRVILRDGAWIFVRSYLKRQPKQERLLLGVESDVKDCDSQLILEAFGQQYPLYSKWSTDRLLSFSEIVSANTTPTQPQTQTHTQPTMANPSGFAAFWSRYPKKLGKGQAEKAWTRLNPQNGLVEVILASVEAHMKTAQWAELQYIPYPATFLNGRRWEDVLSANTTTTVRDPKVTWKNPEYYQTARRQGRVPPQERVPEWEATTTSA